MTFKATLTAVTAALCCFMATAAADDLGANDLMANDPGDGDARTSNLLYRLASSTSLPSSNSWWDYIKFEPGTSRLFMARVDDGLTVYDVDTRKALATVDNSRGANGPLLLPAHDRGHVAMGDGTLLTFELSSLKVLARHPVDRNGGLNSAIYDPATDQLHSITTTRPRESIWYTRDPATGAAIKQTVFPFRKMDDPASDGKGRLFAPARYDQLLLTLDARTLTEKARWRIGCDISKVRYQAETGRILAACTGDKPAFIALDADSGRELARIPIGRGIDGFYVDAARKRIVTSNGKDGTLTVIRQNSADSYELLGTVSTRVGARMMAMDERNGDLYVVNADFTLPPPAADGTQPDEIYHPDSFVVLHYKPS